MSLEELVITTIEKSSGIELPQDERTLLREIVSKHNFDEESARMFGEFYSYYTRDDDFDHSTNIYQKEESIKGDGTKWTNIGISGLMKNCLTKTFLQPTKEYISPNNITRLFKIFNKICQHNKSLAKTNQTDAYLRRLILYQQLMPVLEIFNTCSEDNEIIKNKELCVEIIEKIIDIDIKNKFVKEFEVTEEKRGIVCREIISYLTYNFFSNLNYDVYNYIDLEYAQLFYQFLNQLSRFNNPDNKPINYCELNTIASSHSQEIIPNNTLETAIKFLSRHNPQKETLPEVYSRMIEIINIQIPDYDLIDYLGEGAFKRVYLGRSKIDPDKYVAVAVFDPEHIKKTGQLQLSKIGNTVTPEALEKAIKREFQPSKLDKIKPPHKENVINVHHVGRTEKFAYMIYEPYNINLRDFINEEKIDYKQVRKILSGIASGLLGCHINGVIHRDLHAGNIGLHFDEDKIDRSILTDFGQMSEFSFEQDDEDHSPISPLQTRSPEQFLSRDDFEKYKQTNVRKFPEGCNLDFELQKRANVFNFGCIAYQLITGRTPFWPTNPDGTLVEDPLKQDSADLEGRLEIEKQILEIMQIEKDKKGSYKRFLEKDPTFRKAPRYLRKIITKCLMYNLEDRYDNFYVINRYINGDTPIKRSLGLVFGKNLIDIFYRLAFVTAIVVLGNYMTQNDDELIDKVSIASPSVVMPHEEIEMELFVRQNEEFPKFEIFYHDETKIKDTSKFTGASSVPVEIIESRDFEQDYKKGRIIKTIFDSEGIKAITLDGFERSEKFPHGRYYGSGTVIVLDTTHEINDISNCIIVQRDFLDRDRLTVLIDEVQLFSYAQQLGITKNSFTRGLYWIAMNNGGRAVQKSENPTQYINNLNSILLTGKFFQPIRDRTWFIENKVEPKRLLSDIYLILEKDGKMLFGRKLASEIYSDPNSNAELQGFILAAEKKYFRLGSGTNVYCLRILKDNEGHILIDNRVDFCEWDFRDPDLDRNQQKAGVGFPSSGVHRLNVTALDNNRNVAESSTPRVYRASIDLVVENVQENWSPSLMTNIETSPPINRQTGVYFNFITLTQGQELSIDASKSMFISDYPITDYIIDLGDGRLIRSQGVEIEGLTQKNPINLSDLKFGPITYTNWGFYNLRLTLANQKGDKSSDEILIFVEPPK